MFADKREVFTIYYSLAIAVSRDKVSYSWVTSYKTFVLILYRVGVDIVLTTRVPFTVFEDNTSTFSDGILRHRYNSFHGHRPVRNGDSVLPDHF